MLILGTTGSGKSTLAALFNNEKINAVLKRKRIVLEIESKTSVFG
jgi:polynucleotide 5'-kinase involved in rRNA processing